MADEVGKEITKYANKDLIQLDLDELHVYASDHPGMKLISTVLDGNNYLAWSSEIRNALEAKFKLGFIDGTCLAPAKTSKDYTRWRRLDCMVKSWLLNTLSKDIADVFYYSASSRALWIELEAGYGYSNGLMIYHIQREIALSSQGNMSVTAYYTKLKKLWYELECLVPTPRCDSGGCTCNVNKKIDELNTSKQLFQFLTGLDDAYDHVRSQILLLEPLPHVAKAYSMTLRVEKQRMVNEGLTNTTENVAFQFRTKEPVINFGNKKKIYADKRRLYCENCQKPGHAKETCFKIHGTPDWYKQLVEQKRRTTPTKGFAAVMEDKPGDTLQSQKLNKLVRLLKMMKGRISNDPVTVNFAQLEDFAGCPYIPAFTVNLLSVSKLCASLPILLKFDHSHCVLQDQLTKDTRAIGQKFQNLPILNSNSFIVSAVAKRSSTDTSFVASSLDSCCNQLWHKPLGQSSVLAIKNISSVQLSSTQDNCSCDICPLAKQPRQPFPFSDSNASTRFELVPIDIWGPAMYSHWSNKTKENKHDFSPKS
ncbi:UNVERIFIED_CONTAM: hypothetical protein Sradi_0553800 [Sesamum radiatum]|uniref:Retrotransposon Copia-like N-terminal domain-containing protein n=1 Tax=Sesamum radiatum TaxID=300843 RepID=A0AAW2VJ65_SESRA